MEDSLVDIVFVEGQGLFGNGRYLAALMNSSYCRIRRFALWVTGKLPCHLPRVPFIPNTRSEASGKRKE